MTTRAFVVFAVSAAAVLLAPRAVPASTEKMDVALYRALVGYVTIAFPSGKDDRCKVDARSEFKLDSVDNFNQWWTIDLATACGTNPDVEFRRAYFLCLDFPGRDPQCSVKRVEAREPAKNEAHFLNSSSAGAP